MAYSYLLILLKLSLNPLQTPVIPDIFFVQSRSAEPLSVTLPAEGTSVSIIRALFALKDLLAPGLASVSIAVFPASSLMVPLFNARAIVPE